MTDTDGAKAPGGSAVIEALEALYRAIQARCPELPDCVIITGTGFEGRAQVWGHFRADAWRPASSEEVVRRPELFIAGETLAMGPEHTLGVLLHEAARALNAVQGVKDTSRQGRYHNRRFLTAAEALGLRHPTGRPDPTHGLNQTVLAAGTAERYRDELVYLDAALRLYLDTLQRHGITGSDKPEDDTDQTEDDNTQNGDAPAKPKGNQRATCGCGRIIRASPAVLDAAPILCAACNTPFTVNQ